MIRNIALFPEENPYPVLRADTDGVLLYANRAADNLLAQWQCDIGGMVPQFVLNELLAALEGGLNREMETRCGDRQLSFALVPIPDRNYVNFYGRDVTKKRQIEQALRESEQRYRNLYYHNHEVMLLIDPQDGRITDANAAACDYYGYTLEEIKNLTIQDINTLPPAGISRAMKEVLSQQSRHFWFQHRLADGSTRDVEVFTGTIVLKGQELLYSIVHDITDRKKTEDALRESQQRFASFMLHLPAAAWIKDLQGHYIYANAETERIFSLPSSALPGKKDHDLLPLEMARQFQESDQRVLNDGGSLRETQIVRDSEGTDHYFIMSKFAVPGPSGHPSCIAGIALDITDRIRAEQEIARLNTDLSARAGELQEINRQLEAFNYTVAHDLRRPLTVISGYSQVLSDSYREKLDPQSTEFLQKIQSNTLSMSQLIDDLLNFSHLPHTKLCLEAVDLSEIGKDVAADLELANPQRKVEFRIAEGLCVEGDRNLMRVTLDNLFSNAWKFTAHRKNAVIEFNKTEVNGRTVFFIRDNGLGFSMEDAEKLFKPFQRLPGTQGISGFGIGLATVERIIHCQGGKIWAEGVDGRGATFYFTMKK